MILQDYCHIEKQHKKVGKYYRSMLGSQKYYVIFFLGLVMFVILVSFLKVEICCDSLSIYT